MTRLEARKAETEEKFKQLGLTWETHSISKQKRKKIQYRGSNQIAAAVLEPNDYNVRCSIFLGRHGFRWQTGRHLDGQDKSLQRAIIRASEHVILNVEEKIRTAEHTLSGSGFSGGFTGVAAAFNFAAHHQK